MRTTTRPRSSIATSRLSAGLAVALVAVGCQPGLRSEATDAASAESVAEAVTSVAMTEARRSSHREGVVELPYEDVTGADRTVRIELRMPDDAEGPVPVVVWSHGGSRGKNDPAKVGETWGRAFNEAGFAFVAVAHPGHTDAERVAVCEAIGAERCDEFNTLFWDRPYDIQQVFDWIDEHGGDSGIDPDRIVYGGHSAGAISTMVVAGMDWVFGSELAPPSDDRPIAFVVASPLGVEARGLSEERLDGLDRPMLFLTGEGDTTSSTEGPDRRATFALLPDEPASFLLYIDDPLAKHGVFNLSRDACGRASGSTQHCRTLLRTLARSGTEFVASVTTDGDANDYFDLVDSSLDGPFEWEATTR